MNRAYYWVSAFVRNVVSVRGITALLSSFGALWLAVEIANHFSSEIGSQIKNNWPWFFVAGIAFTSWQCRPATHVQCTLQGRDVTVEIRVGNIFQQDGDLIIGTNTTFDTRLAHNLISEESIQGVFTKKYFADERALDNLINPELANVQSVALPGPRVGKSAEYPIGTTVQVAAREGPRTRRAFLVAMARINEHGTAHAVFDELLESLGVLWEYIATRSSKGVLLIPVLGSRFGRLTQRREELIHEIIKSFVAASASATFCDRLVIVISGKDVVEQKLDLKALGAYLHHICNYTKLTAPSAGANGGTVVP